MELNTENETFRGWRKASVFILNTVFQEIYKVQLHDVFHKKAKDVLFRLKTIL